VPIVAFGEVGAEQTAAASPTRLPSLTASMTSVLQIIERSAAARMSEAGGLGHLARAPSFSTSAMRRTVQ
jgi:ABC-type methionine transport system permease subunit